MAYKTYLNLKSEDTRKFFIKYDELQKIREELDLFLEHEKSVMSKSFARKVMFSHELKANNGVEGYKDDIEFIKAVIEKTKDIVDDGKRKRVLNLSKAYKYILEKREINSDSLRMLYSKISQGILDPDDMSLMGEYYRNDAVMIVGGRLDKEPDYGMDYHLLEEFMDDFFDFLNNPAQLNGMTDYYLKSQILHFYFVYIHPYFDCNGRTSRTVAMWYLLNNEAYPYIIFNRGIMFARSGYDKAIENTKKFRDLTFFVKYMMNTVKLELEKEYLVQSVASNGSKKLSGLDYQTLLYFLSLNGLRTVCDFASLYNKKNERKNIREIYEEMIDPLITAGILSVSRSTAKNMFGDTPNQVLTLNPRLYDDDPCKIKSLKL